MGATPAKAAVEPPTVPVAATRIAPTPPTGYVWDDGRTVYPTGDGYNNGDWNAVGAASKYACVDEPSPNDSDYVRGDGGNDESDYQLFTFEVFTQPIFRYAAVTVYYRARDNLWATFDDNNIQAALQVNGVRYHAGSHNPPGATASGEGDFADYSYTWSTNPATGLAWTLADIAAIEQFGFYSNDLQPSIRISAVRMEVDYVRRYPFVSFSFANPHISESYGGEMGLGVKLSNPTDETISVSYSATPGTALPVWTTILPRVPPPSPQAKPRDKCAAYSTLTTTSTKARRPLSSRSLPPLRPGMPF
jgi:hypothetical protein